MWGFVDDATFLTKGGAVGVVYRLRRLMRPVWMGRRGARQPAVRQALRQLDEDCRLYQYLVKEPARRCPWPAHPDPVVAQALRQRAESLQARADGLFDFELYTVLLFEGWRSGRSRALGVARIDVGGGLGVRDHSLSTGSPRRCAQTWARRCGHLHAQAEAWAAQLADVFDA